MIDYTVINHSMLLDFVKRWHLDTSSFNLPCSELSITLDDVSSLLHLLSMGRLLDTSLTSSGFMSTSGGGTYLDYLYSKLDEGCLWKTR